MHSSNQTSNKFESLSRGFTIVELILVIAISGILVVSLVSFISSTTKQFGVTSARSAQTTQLSLATDRIDNDIKGATAVLNYSPADPSGPNGMPWQTSANRLVLSTAARDSNDEPIPGANGYATDTIIYYLKNGSLYRRLIAANHAGNRYTTKTCSDTTTQGGCAGDTKITDNVQEFSLVFYKKGDNTTPLSPPITTNEVNIIKTKLTLSRQQSGQTIKTESSTTSPLQKKQDDGRYSLNGKLFAGPGGLSSQSDTFINGSISVVGTVRPFGGSTFGTETEPITLNAANIGCTVAGEWPRSCAPAEPLVDDNISTIYTIYGTVCASNQVRTSRISPASGLIPNCNPSISAPSFNKQRFVKSMKNTAPSPSCSTGTTRTLAANTTYTGNYSPLWCTTVLTGDIYIKGKFTISNGLTTIKIAEGVTQRPLVVVDRAIDFFNVKIEPNLEGIGADFVSFDSMDVACSTAPDCTGPLPEAVQKDSILSTTAQFNPAIALKSVNGPKSSFYAYYGRIDLHTANVGPIAGQRVGVFTSNLNLSY